MNSCSFTVVFLPETQLFSSSCLPEVFWTPCLASRFFSALCKMPWVGPYRCDGDWECGQGEEGRWVYNWWLGTGTDIGDLYWEWNWQVRMRRIDVVVFDGFGSKQIKLSNTIGRPFVIYSDSLVEDLIEPCSAHLDWPTTHLQLAVAGHTFTQPLQRRGQTRTQFCAILKPKELMQPVVVTVIKQLPPEDFSAPNAQSLCICHFGGCCKLCRCPGGGICPGCGNNGCCRSNNCGCDCCKSSVTIADLERKPMALFCPYKGCRQRVFDDS